MKVPNHIVLFPDGNRRWAKEKGVQTIEGHLAGYKNLINFCNWCRKRGVKVLTAFGFSTENWKRPKEEVQYLMRLFEEFLSQEIERLRKEGAKIKIIGEKEKLPPSLQKIIQKVEDLTKNNNDYVLNLAVSYGGRWDILQAVRKIVEKKIPSREITEEMINSHLSTAGLPDPDLIIRAGGEQRLSNFVLWQAAYSELYFSEKYWPDFSEQELEKAIEEYDRRQRRFGH